MGRKKPITAQTFVEYTLLIGAVVALLIAMMPMLRRSSQAMVQVVADQVGVQSGAEQEKSDDGYFLGSNATTYSQTHRYTKERLGTTTYMPDETIATDSKMMSNLGFTRE